MRLESSGFTEGGPLPAKYATTKVTGGRNLSPPLLWTEVPAKTKSFALAVFDPHPVARKWVHWLVADLPPEARALAEGASPKGMPPGALELLNSFGAPGYGGPQPPPGSGVHPYVFRLYALDVAALRPPADVGLARFEAALSPHVLAKAELTGYFER